MVLVHFADPQGGQPLCGDPERQNWLWAADPHEVTCPRCYDLLRRQGSADAEAGASQDPA